MKAQNNKKTANERIQKVRDSLPALEARFLEAFRTSVRLARRVEQLRAAESPAQYGKAGNE